VILLLFSVGLETKPASILNVGGTAAAVAVLGIVAPFAAGWGIMRALGDPNIESLFVGTAMVATSVGITARVLGELGVMSQQSARIFSARRWSTTSSDCCCWPVSPACRRGKSMSPVWPPPR